MAGFYWQGSSKSESLPIYSAGYILWRTMAAFFSLYRQAITDKIRPMKTALRQAARGECRPRATGTELRVTKPCPLQGIVQNHQKAVRVPCREGESIAETYENGLQGEDRKLYLTTDLA